MSEFSTLGEIAAAYGRLTWAWPGWIPRGHLTLLVGPQESGKSYLTAHFIAVFTGGGGQRWPDGSKHKGPQGKVLLLETEGFRGIYAQRLKAMGVACDQVLFLGKDPFYVPQLPDDLERAERLAAEEGCVCIAIDSLSGGHNHKENDAEMKRVLQPLAQMAARLGIAVILVHHCRKLGVHESPQPTLDRVRGSTAITQYCRSVVGLWRPNEGGRVRVELLKSNLGQKARPLGFDIGATGLVFGAAPAVSRGSERARAVLSAAEWLRRELAAGPCASAELVRKADRMGIPRATLYRARKLLEVDSPVNGRWQLRTEEQDLRSMVRE